MFKSSAQRKILMLECCKNLSTLTLYVKFILIIILDNVFASIRGRASMILNLKFNNMWSNLNSFILTAEIYHLIK